MEARTLARDLLIALNSCPGLPRAAACRLGLELDRWSGEPWPAARLAAELALPAGQAELALSLLPRAGRAAGRELARAERLGARLLTLADPGYPPALRQLALPPPVLYLRGDLPDAPAVAVVGSRRADPYGVEAAELFGRALAAAGATVVSGFARGVDSAAHRGALAVPGGRTVAVLGCGLEVDYPKGNAGLGEEIAARGALVTEFPCGVEPRPWHFPVRNRIIAALAAGTLVVQAAPRSGSLSTARHALDLGREVYAVPGRIFDERSLGTNALIRDGAMLVQHPRDILEDLGLASAPANQGRLAAAARELPAGLPGEILAALPPGVAANADDLAVRLGTGVDRIQVALLELEMDGRIRREAGPVFSAA